MAVDREDDLIEIENTSRDVLVFPLMSTDGKKEVGRLVLGDAADKVPYQGVRDPALQPNPVVQLSRKEWDALGATNLRVLQHYIDAGVLLVRNVA